MHLVVLPLAFIVPAVFEVKRTVAVLLPVAFVALVPASLRNVLTHELQLHLLVLGLGMVEVREG